MATARSSAPNPDAPRRRLPDRRRMSWSTGLILGLCLGLGYGVTHRLLRLNPGVSWSGFQPFGVKAFPGTPLDTLRERYDAEGQKVRVDLDRLERERQEQARQRRQEEDLARRRAEMEARERRLEQAEREAAERALEEEVSLPPLPEPAPAVLEPPLPRAQEAAAGFAEPELPPPSAPRPPLDGPPAPPPPLP